VRHSSQLVILLLVFVAAGCAERGSEPKSLAEYRALWVEERRALEEGLDQLEERLLVDQARVRFWIEMRDRHQSATAVACNVLGQHADAIASFEEQQRRKTDSLAKKHRVASAFVPSTESVR
jgi:hypothetical protein